MPGYYYQKALDAARAQETENAKSCGYTATEVRAKYQQVFNMYKNYFDPSNQYGKNSSKSFKFYQVCTPENNGVDRFYDLGNLFTKYLLDSCKGIWPEDTALKNNDLFYLYLQSDLPEGTCSQLMRLDQIDYGIQVKKELSNSCPYYVFYVPSVPEEINIYARTSNADVLVESPSSPDYASVAQRGGCYMHNLITGSAIDSWIKFPFYRDASGSVNANYLQGLYKIIVVPRNKQQSTVLTLSKVLASQNSNTGLEFLDTFGINEKLPSSCDPVVYNLMYRGYYDMGAQLLDLLLSPTDSTNTSYALDVKANVTNNGTLDVNNATITLAYGAQTKTLTEDIKAGTTIPINETITVPDSTVQTVSIQVSYPEQNLDIDISNNSASKSVTIKENDTPVPDNNTVVENPVQATANTFSFKVAAEGTESWQKTVYESQPYNEKKCTGDMVLEKMQKQNVLQDCSGNQDKHRKKNIS